MQIAVIHCMQYQLINQSCKMTQPFLGMLHEVIQQRQSLLCCAARDGHPLQARAARDAEVVYTRTWCCTKLCTDTGFYVARRYCV